MHPDKIELLEQTVMEIVVQALTDYYDQANTIFQEEKDCPQDIAEDVTQEALDTMEISRIQERLYGKVDYKKAIYAFLPKATLVALMVDSKSEKWDVQQNTVTIQMSQTSMSVRMYGGTIHKAGELEKVIQGNLVLQVVTVIIKYVWAKINDAYALSEIVVVCIPNGELQEHYNSSADDTIWRAGRDKSNVRIDYRGAAQLARQGCLDAPCCLRIRFVTPFGGSPAPTPPGGISFLLAFAQPSTGR